MSRPPLPLPPTRPLPMPPLAVAATIAAAEPITVRTLAYNQLEVRVHNVVAIITRAEAFRLLGQLEREAGML